MGNLGVNPGSEASAFGPESSALRFFIFKQSYLMFFALALQVSKLLYCTAKSGCCCAPSKEGIEVTKKGGGWKKTVLASRDHGESCSSRKEGHEDIVISVAPV